MTYRAVAFTAGVLLLPAAQVDSCDCPLLPQLSDAVRTETPAVFEGTVVEIIDREVHTTRVTTSGASNNVEASRRQVIFEVSRSWNGVAQKRISILADGSNCDFRFEIDHVYVVFAHEDERRNLTTGICTRTAESSKATDIIKRLGQASVPE